MHCCSGTVQSLSLQSKGKGGRTRVFFLLHKLGREGVGVGYRPSNFRDQITLKNYLYFIIYHSTLFCRHIQKGISKSIEKDMIILLWSFGVGRTAYKPIDNIGLTESILTKRSSTVQ